MSLGRVATDPQALVGGEFAKGVQLFATSAASDARFKSASGNPQMVGMTALDLSTIVDRFDLKVSGIAVLERGYTVEEVADGNYDRAVGRLVYAVVKRLLDVVLSAAALLILSPLWLPLVLFLKLTQGGPLLYAHTRVGLNGREFRCYKFRTMHVNADAQKQQLHEFNIHDDLRTFKIPNDPRVTRVGRWLRRTSIDETPQLINVLLGDMSLVGPRPSIPSEVEKYSWHDMRRLEVKPGLTCIWQVSGRSRLGFTEQIKLDLEYIENRCFRLDAVLLFKTIPAVVSCDGAY